MRQVRELLVVRVGVYGRHQAVIDPESFVEHLGELLGQGGGAPLEMRLGELGLLQLAGLLLSGALRAAQDRLQSWQELEV